MLRFVHLYTIKKIARYWKEHVSKQVCVRYSPCYCFKNDTGSNTFNLIITLMTRLLISLPYRWWNWGTEWLRNLLEFTHSHLLVNYIKLAVCQTKGRWPLQMQTRPAKKKKKNAHRTLNLKVPKAFWKHSDFVRVPHITLWVTLYSNRYFPMPNTEETILNITKTSGNCILYVMLSFLADSWKAVKMMFCGKVNLADFFMRCLLSLE